MGQIRTRIKTTTPSTPFEINLEKELLSFSLVLAALLNSGLKFEDNFNAEILDIADTGAADATQALAHTLKRIPTGFLVLNIDKPGIFYAAGTSWTTTTIYLKCNVANCAVKVMVF